jgi:hypothetical protein
VLAVRDPHASGSYGAWPIRLLTGWECPACGGRRAVHHLAHGDVPAAAGDNLLFVASVPVLLGLWAWWLLRRWRGIERPLPRRTTVAAAAVLLALMVAFTIVRNTTLLT